ncbi:META domain-containing protein [Thiocapsa imhoffii]|nr:META domain-containing protein [Thiocapsa imhoffii]
MSHLRTLLVMSLLGIALPALATDPPGQTPDLPTAAVEDGVAARLSATPWRIIAYRAEGDLTPLPARETPARLNFGSDGIVSFNLGCNSFSGTFSSDGEGLTIGPRMASTMMACEDDLMTLDQVISLNLVLVAGYREQAAQLDLVDADGTVVVSLEPLIETPLLGVNWRLAQLNKGQGALSSPLQGTEISMTLTPEGRLSGSDGCNRYVSAYALQDDSLTIRPVGTTRMTCRARPAVADQAEAYLATLSQVRRYRVDGRELWLSDEYGQTLARFRAPTGMPVERPEP